MAKSLSPEESKVLNMFMDYTDIVFRICLGFTRNPWEAEELMQDVYLKALKKISSLKNHEFCKEWLFRITRNTCLNYVKRERLHKSFLRSKGKNILEHNTPESNYSLKEQSQIIKEAIHRLPQKKREVLIFKEYGHMTYKEISDTLGIKVGTVMSRLNRAREAIISDFKRGKHG